MSPSRSRRQFVRARPRAEVITAVAVGVAIVVGTVLLIWLLRPGTTGVPGGGGLLSRQPRVTILVVLTAAALFAAIARIRATRRRPARLSERGAILAGSAVVLALAIVAGVFWPGGVVRHWPKRPKLADTPATSSIPAPASTTATSPATTAAGSSAPPTTNG